MFTGIITSVGEVKSIEGQKVVIKADYDPSTIDLGASIACDGCCLTVTEKGVDGDGCYFNVDVSNETFSCTTLENWKPGSKVNLERSLSVGAELGGHIVTGHVDGLAEITDIKPDGASRRFTIMAPPSLGGYIAPKGSIALNGTSLTVNEVDGASFGVNLIPHTLEVTTWGGYDVGHRINLEVDLLARYVARLTSYNQS